MRKKHRTITFHRIVGLLRYIPLILWVAFFGLP